MEILPSIEILPLRVTTIDPYNDLTLSLQQSSNWRSEGTRSLSRIHLGLARCWRRGRSVTSGMHGGPNPCETPLQEPLQYSAAVVGIGSDRHCSPQVPEESERGRQKLRDNTLRELGLEPKRPRPRYSCE